MIYEVFRQERKGQPFVHGGSFHAPEPGVRGRLRAGVLRPARRVGRLWVVPREAIVEIDEFPDEFDLKYRRVDGYSIKARLKEARERAGTAAP